ncbi:hypothetical protein BJY16_007531 [Actinoplanes octamycinicus]|uniref:Baseplate assembly protein n=1 Tax=Actinoplanes octamycinicus TaxID=135948 RepID=A0A7W7H569_9ACTN|nr:putative baseplate assembly protein [Actinoplanes octamycinicus]MBB4744072.1 hypothetical protein [Actinoplanes octamycinicus]GIE56971.1 hypothetical protein Aoc01nite_23730 [Actinoplanes octamycinicus]
MSGPPPVDRRTPADLVAQTERLLQRHAGWQRVPVVPELLLGRTLNEDVTDPGTGQLVASAGTVADDALLQVLAAVPGLGRIAVVPEPDPAYGLVRIFARMLEQLVERVNQVPDRNLAAFLDLIGVDLLPARAARVPLTFRPATAAQVDPLVPAGTRVSAAPLDGESDPVVFETENDLVVPRTRLVAVLTRDPAADRYRDSTGRQPFPAFTGDRPMTHDLFLDRLTPPGPAGEPEAVTLRFRPAEGNQPWPAGVTWAAWDGGDWADVPATTGPAPVGGAWEVHLPAVPPPTGGRWLRARLAAPLPRDGADRQLPRITQIQRRVVVRRSGLLPAQAVTADGPADPGDRFLPFGERPHVDDAVYLAHSAAFGTPGAVVTVDIPVGNPRRPQSGWPRPPVRPSPGLAVAWEYWTGQRWAELGRGTPLPGDRVLEPYVTSVETTDVTIGGQRPPGAVVTIERIHPPAAADTVPAGDTSWQRTLTGLQPGMSLFRIGVPNRPPVLAPVFRAGAGVDPVPLTLDPAPGIVAESPLVVAGSCGLAAGTAVLYNAATGTRTDVPLAGGRFEVPVTLAGGRNDLAVLVLDNAGRAVAGEVLPVVLQPAGFADATWAFTRPGQVTFQMPADAAPREVNGVAGAWVRARVASGGYGEDARYIPDGSTRPVYRLVPETHQPPAAGPCTIGYTAVSPFAPITAVRSDNDQTPRDHAAALAAGQEVQPFVPSADDRPTLYLGFAPPAFGNRPVTLFLGVAETRYTATPASPPAADPTLAWEYWNGSGWAPLGVRDRTRALTRSGLVTFLGPADQRESTEFGRSACWLRVRWLSGGYPEPPRLRHVLTGTTWATQSRTVRDEILGSSNGEPGQVFRLSGTPVLPGEQIQIRSAGNPSGDTVENWVGVGDFYESGPSDRHYVLDRASGTVTFGDGRRGLIPPPGRGNVRAVRYQVGGGARGNRAAGTIVQLKTAVPYVDSVTNVEPARGGAPAETAAAARERGPRTLRHRDRAVAVSDFEDLARQASSDVARVAAIAAGPGSVTVIVVPRDPVPQPVPDLELLGRVDEHLRARMTPTATLTVAGPDWLRTRVDAEVVPSAEAGADLVAGVLARLAAFLHPVTGGPDGAGWDFGRRPHRSELYAVIEEVPGVDHVSALSVTNEADGPVRADRLLTYGGAHRIVLREGDDDADPEP